VNEILSMTGLLRSYLLEDEAVTAITTQIAHSSPAESDRVRPWVRITQLDARNETRDERIEHLVNYYMQLDCYAGANNRFTEAEDLNRAVRAALVRMPEHTLEGVVVSSVVVASNPAPADTDLTPARQRFILEVEILAHPDGES